MIRICKMQSLVGKNIHRSIFQLSIPGMISSVFHTFFQLVDSFWVGKIGAGALAAIGASSFMIWALFSLTALSTNGISTLVAQYMGAGKPIQARQAAGQGFILSTISGFFLALVFSMTSTFWFDIMGLDGAVLVLAQNYFEIIMFGFVFSFWFSAAEAVFRGFGDTRTPMIILGLMLLVNAIIDPVLIFGWVGMPALGVSGAALATILSELTGTILLLIFLRKKQFLPVFKAASKPGLIQFGVQTRFLHIGMPVALNGFLFSLIYVFLTNIISRFGMGAVAAVGVCHRIEGIAWFASVGFSVAAATLVGQFSGAGQEAKASAAGWLVSFYGILVLSTVSVFYYFYAAPLMTVFTDDPVVQAIGIEYLRIVAIFEIFLALEVIMEGIFSGAGYTLPVVLVTVPLTAARIPLAWWFAIVLDIGTAGIWWAIALTTMLKGVLNTILFIAGFWKKKLHIAGK